MMELRVGVLRFPCLGVEGDWGRKGCRTHLYQSLILFYVLVSVRFGGF